MKTAFTPFRGKSIVIIAVLTASTIMAVSALLDLLRFQLTPLAFLALVVCALSAVCFITARWGRATPVEAMVSAILLSWCSVLLLKPGLVPATISAGPSAVFGLAAITPIPYVVLAYLGSALGAARQPAGGASRALAPIMVLAALGLVSAALSAAAGLVHLPVPAEPVAGNGEGSASTPGDITPTAPAQFPPEATVSFDGRSITLHNISAGNAARLELVIRIKTGKGVKYILFSPDGSMMAIVRRNGSVELWDASRMELIDSYEAKAGIGAAAFGPNQLLFATCGDTACVSDSGSTVFSWQIASNQVTTLGSYSEFIIGLSPDGKAVAGTSLGRFEGTQWNSGFPKTNELNKYRFDVWRLQGDSPVQLEALGEVNVPVGDPHLSAVFTADGNRVRLGGSYSADGSLEAYGEKNQVVIVDASGQQEFVPQRPSRDSGHTGTVNTVAFSPDSTLLASGASDRTVRVWNLEDRASLSSGQSLVVLGGHTIDVLAVAFSPNQTLLVSASADSDEVMVWGVP